jgi:hypothetical protein
MSFLASSVTIIFNSISTYDAIRISNNHVEIAYDIPNDKGPVYSKSKLFKSVLDIMKYVDILVRMVGIDKKPAKWIELQADLFPNMMISAADFQSMHSSGLLADAIKQSIEP